MSSELDFMHSNRVAQGISKALEQSGWNFYYVWGFSEMDKYS
jgi:hypothetical protein